ncbi:MAG TPA: malonyl-CoA decarboxylase, partial [Geminicoccaceae bacterium]
LLSTKGDASGAAIAREVVETLRALPDSGRLEFFGLLAQAFAVDHERLLAAARAYEQEPGLAALLALRRATEAPRLELFRRMNMAPNGTRAIVRLREQLLPYLGEHPELRAVDADLHALLTSWFNPGFLSLARMDWNSPASLLEKFLRYERVHKMAHLDDLKRRLAADRRCFAFFHPALPDEPLIFVQVALVQGMADAVRPLIDPDGAVRNPAEVVADAAVFYSISNCQDGLRGVSLGSFLIKLVVADLQQQLPGIKTFATLSPIPGFADWLRQEQAREESPALGEPELRAAFDQLDTPGWHDQPELAEQLRQPLTRLCAHYLVRERRGGRPRDAVARFHLGNGARLERLNWLADRSEKGLRESFGLLVNYRYDPGTIERNHEVYTNNGEVVCSPAVRSLLPSQG